LATDIQFSQLLRSNPVAALWPGFRRSGIPMAVQGDALPRSWRRKYPEHYAAAAAGHVGFRGVDDTGESALPWKLTLVRLGRHTSGDCCIARVIQIALPADERLSPLPVLCRDKESTNRPLVM